MKFTNKTAIKLLKAARSPELNYRISIINDKAELEYREATFIRSDLSILKEEAEYLISLSEEEGTAIGDELRDARELLRRTRNGKSIPVTDTFDLMFSPDQIQYARDLVNEYKRVKALIKKIEEV